MEDMLELAGEVQETLGRAYGLPDDVDEEDLEAGEKKERDREGEREGERERERERERE